MTDFFDELGELALGSRLKRLSDRLYSDALAVYKRYNMPVQPKWFTLLALLDKKKRVSIVEAAELLKLSQPALSQFSKQLVAEGLVEILADDSDSRKRMLSLSSAGIVTVANMKSTWRGVEKAARDLCTDGANDFYPALLKLEQSLNSESLLMRTQNHLQAAETSNQLEFIPYSEDLAPFFEVINTQWIESMFSLEEIDKQVLRKPGEFIVEPGGHIFFAKHPHHGIVGTCALLKSGEDEFELTKMGVLLASRGLKIGERLLSHVIAQAEKLGCKRLYLLTNKKCEAAIHLYEKLGFVHSQDIMDEFGYHYERCDVAMIYSPC